MPTDYDEYLRRRQEKTGEDLSGGGGSTWGNWAKGIGGKIGDAWDWITDKEGKDRRNALADKFVGQGDIGFADYQRRGAALDESAGFLGDVMRGKRSVSAEQLRQGMQQSVAQQRALAASARPGNQAMAARQAAVGAGNAASGLMGQQALAGLQERQNAARAYGQLMGQARGQDLQAGLGYGQHAAALQGAYGPEQGAKAGLIGGLASAAGAIFSDVRVKENIGGGDSSVEEWLSKMKPQTFDYKPGYTSHGTGAMDTYVSDAPPQDPDDDMIRRTIASRAGVGTLGNAARQGQELGIMAQDLEKSRMGQRMVQDTPRGKTIDGKRLLTGVAAATANLNRRLRALEGKGKK